MDSKIRQKLQQELSDYILNTLKYIKTVKKFCDGKSKWTSKRQTELEMMRDIKDRADRITLKFDHVKEAENKTKAFGEYMHNTFTQFKADSKRQELEKELGEVLEKTLKGLEKLQHFLDAVEMLAVTSLSVFMDERFMTQEVSSISVCSMISGARFVAPLLVHFKRDAGAFFLPSLGNVEVLIIQLDKYTSVTQQICEKMEIEKFNYISAFEYVFEGKRGESSLKFNLNMSKKSVQKLHDHLLQLTKIRMDESFRMNFLFETKAQDFIKLFSESQPRMDQFLSDLDKAADQLDKMKKGSKISSVAGSSVGVTGGVLTIVGLALAPVTAGVSLGLTVAGVGLGVTSGVNSLVTGVTEMAVNSHHGKNANNIFTSFMEDVQKILDCLEEVASIESLREDDSLIGNAVRLAARAGGVGKGIDAIVDAASAVKALRNEEVIGRAVGMGLQEAKAGRNIPKLAADLPDIGQLAKGTPLAISKGARVGFIAANALFIGLDVFFICKDSISLSKGSKNGMAQLIRSRSVLWRSEVEAWKKIHDHLLEGIFEFVKNKEILKQPLNI